MKNGLHDDAIFEKRLSTAAKPRLPVQSRMSWDGLSTRAIEMAITPRACVVASVQLVRELTRRFCDVPLDGVLAVGPLALGEDLPAVANGEDVGVVFEPFGVPDLGSVLVELRPDLQMEKDVSGLVLALRRLLHCGIRVSLQDGAEERHEPGRIDALQVLRDVGKDCALVERSG